MVLEWLRSSILQDKSSEIGKIKTFEKEVNLNSDRKRMWFEDLKDVKDGKTIDSLHISLNFIKEKL